MRATLTFFPTAFLLIFSGCGTMRNGSPITADTKTWDAMNDCAKKYKDAVSTQCGDQFKDTAITGNVRDARINQGGIDLDLSISQTPYGSRYVTCQLDAGTFKEEAARLTKGDSVTVKGILTRVTNNPSTVEIVLNPCELTNSPTPAPR